MALKVKAQEKLQKIGTYAGKYRNGDCYSTGSHIVHGRVETRSRQAKKNNYSLNGG